MQKLLIAIDKVSTFVGQTFAWFIVALTLMISWEVFSRYVLDAPHPWAFDVMIMMYGTVFMMAGAYTLSKNGHVRGDVLYGFFSPRLQAGLQRLQEQKAFPAFLQYSDPAVLGSMSRAQVEEKRSAAELRSQVAELDARIAEALTDHPANDELLAAVVLEAAPKKVTAVLQSGETIAVLGEGLRPAT